MMQGRAGMLWKIFVSLLQMILACRGMLLSSATVRPSWKWRLLRVSYGDCRSRIVELLHFRLSQHPAVIPWNGIYCRGRVQLHHRTDPTWLDTTRTNMTTRKRIAQCHDMVRYAILETCIFKNTAGREWSNSRECRSCRRCRTYILRTQTSKTKLAAPIVLILVRWAWEGSPCRTHRFLVRKVALPVLPQQFRLRFLTRRVI